MQVVPRSSESLGGRAAGLGNFHSEDLCCVKLEVSWGWGRWAGLAGLGWAEERPSVVVRQARTHARDMWIRNTASAQVQVQDQDAGVAQREETVTKGWPPSSTIQESRGGDIQTEGVCA